MAEAADLDREAPHPADADEAPVDEGARARVLAWLDRVSAPKGEPAPPQEKSFLSLRERRLAALRASWAGWCEGERCGKAAESFFGRCERDEGGHCKPGTGGGGGEEEEAGVAGEADADEAGEEWDAYEEEAAEYQQARADFEAEHAAWEEEHAAWEKGGEERAARRDALIDAESGIDVERHGRARDAIDPALNADLRLRRDLSAEGGVAWADAARKWGTVTSELFAEAADDTVKEAAELGLVDKDRAAVEAAAEKGKAAVQKATEKHAAAVEASAAAQQAFHEYPNRPEPEEPDLSDSEPEEPDWPGPSVPRGEGETFDAWDARREAFVTSWEAAHPEETAAYEKAVAAYEKAQPAWEKEVEKANAAWEKDTAKWEKEQEKREALSDKADALREKEDDAATVLDDAWVVADEKLTAAFGKGTERAVEALDKEDEAADEPDEPEYDGPDEPEQPDVPDPRQK